MDSRIAQFLAATALAAVACAAAAADKPDKSLQVHNPSLKVQWASPDARVPPFDRIMLAPMETEYRQVPPMTGPVGTPQTRNEFPVTDEDKERVAKTFTEIFGEELGKSSHYKLTDQPGPGVLLVKPALRDIVSRMPPEEPPGRSDVFLDSVGDATLVVDFVDSATGKTLGSAADRRTAQPAGSMGGDFGAVRADRVGAGQEVRRLARRWAVSLERRIDQLYFEAKPR